MSIFKFILRLFAIAYYMVCFYLLVVPLLVRYIFTIKWEDFWWWKCHFLGTYLLKDAYLGWGWHYVAGWVNAEFRFVFVGVDDGIVWGMCESCSEV